MYSVLSCDFLFKRMTVTYFCNGSTWLVFIENEKQLSFFTCQLNFEIYIKSADAYYRHVLQKHFFFAIYTTKTIIWMIIFVHIINVGTKLVLSTCRFAGELLWCLCHQLMVQMRLQTPFLRQMGPRCKCLYKIPSMYANQATLQFSYQPSLWSAWYLHSYVLTLSLWWKLIAFCVCWLNWIEYS
jgi:hypothetical protein